MNHKRLRHFRIGALAYAACLVLLGVVAWAGFIPWRAALQVSAAILSANLTIYVLLRTGLSERFGDPSLTWLQIVMALAILMLGVYHFDYDRALPLTLSLVILAFGVFRFNTREFMLASGLVLAGYAGVINLLMWFKPEVVNVYGEGLRWLSLALVLPCYALIGARVSEMRARLQPASEQLTQAHALIERMATHDALTNLPNRALFTATLERAVANAERNKREVAVLYVDIDRFKVVNDALGHGIGDAVIRQAAERLAATTRASDFMARIGGDEFSLLVEDYRHAHELRELALRILGEFRCAWIVGEQKVALAASVGICTYPDGAPTADMLLSNAEIAMYRAKEQGRDRFCFYTAELNVLSLEQLELESQFAHALESGQFELHYQPKVDLATGRVAGVEALMRWRHPERGMLFPGRFIRLAEESGFIGKLDLWGVRWACERLAAWRAQGLRTVPVALNLSARQFNEPHLVGELQAILKATGLPPGDLELEITENILMRDPEKALAVMQRLRAMGVCITIDDFGTGYSSLGYLKRFPIQRLKIDRAFIEDLPRSREDLAITSAIIAMAHSLGMSVVAEGVELEDQYRILASQGCDEYQGYFCRPPLTESELLVFLQDAAAEKKAGSRLPALEVPP